MLWIIGVCFIISFILIIVLGKKFNQNDDFTYDDSLYKSDSYSSDSLYKSPASAKATTNTIHQNVSTGRDIDNSYAFANRLKNIIFSRQVDENKIISDLHLTADELKKYKFSKGLPTSDILKKFENYFNVDFTYLSDCRGETIYVYKNGNIIYSVKAHYPHKGRFDKMGNCIFIDYVNEENQEYIVHLSNSGTRLGTISGLHDTQYLKISDDGQYALAVSDAGYATLINLHQHTIMKQCNIGIQGDINIKDLSTDKIELRFIRNQTIVFSLKFNFTPLDIVSLLAYHAQTKNAPRYLSNNYYTLFEWMQFMPNGTNNYFKDIVELISLPNNKKYFSSKKMARSLRALGEKYMSLSENDNAIYLFGKALEFDPNVGVKKLLNQLK